VFELRFYCSSYLRGYFTILYVLELFGLRSSLVPEVVDNSEVQPRIRTIVLEIQLVIFSSLLARSLLELKYNCCRTPSYTYPYSTDTFLPVLKGALLSAVLTD
jgi:hypothetical protein